MAEKRLYRTKGKLAGVCSGLAEYLNTDVVIVRIIWLVFTFILTGIGPLAYIICAIVLPKKEDIDNSATQAPHCEDSQASESTLSEKHTSSEQDKEEESKKAAETQGKDYDSNEYNKTVTGYQK